MVTYTVYALLAAWQDLRHRGVSRWVYLVFAGIGAVQIGFRGVVSLPAAGAAMLPGILLLLLTRCSRGAIGAGDGYFFLVSAFYLSMRDITLLLCFGLLLCTACCLGIVVWGCIAGVNVRKKRLPFLAFVFPAWIWMALF